MDRRGGAGGRICGITFAQALAMSPGISSTDTVIDVHLLSASFFLTSRLGVFAKWMRRAGHGTCAVCTTCCSLRPTLTLVRLSCDHRSDLIRAGDSAGRYTERIARVGSRAFSTTTITTTSTATNTATTATAVLTAVAGLTGLDGSV
jgi:hypothetical protein